MMKMKFLEEAISCKMFINDQTYYFFSFPGQPKAGCQFPDWISGAKFGQGKNWESLDGSLRLQFQPHLQDGVVDRRVAHSGSGH